MEAKGRLARWIMDLQEFDFSVLHRAGRIHNNADALSRLVPTNSSNSTSSIHVQDEQKPIFVSTIRVKLSQGRTAIDDDKLYLTTLTLSAEAGFHNGRVKKA